ncbi:hypothetical protein S245_030198, partial [Arachis hypogaea]
TSASLEENTESLDVAESDLESTTVYSSVDTTDTSLHPTDRRLLIASSGGSLSKNKTEGEAWDLIKDVAESTQHTRVRSNSHKGVVEPPPSEASLTKALGDMTTILTQMQRDQREYYSIQAVQAPPLVAQLEGPPRIYGLCSSTTHYTDQCHQIQEEHALVVANVNYNNRPPYPPQGQNNYHQG